MASFLASKLADKATTAYNSKVEFIANLDNILGSSRPSQEFLASSFNNISFVHGRDCMAQ